MCLRDKIYPLSMQQQQYHSITVLRYILLILICTAAPQKMQPREAKRSTSERSKNTERCTAPGRAAWRGPTHSSAHGIPQDWPRVPAGRKDERETPSVLFMFWAASFLCVCVFVFVQQKQTYLPRSWERTNVEVCMISGCCCCCCLISFVDPVFLVRTVLSSCRRAGAHVGAAAGPHAGRGARQTAPAYQVSYSCISLSCFTVLLTVLLLLCYYTMILILLCRTCFCTFFCPGKSVVRDVSAQGVTYCCSRVYLQRTCTARTTL